MGLSISALARKPSGIGLRKTSFRTDGLAKQYKFKISEVDAWVDSGKSARIE